MSKKIRRYKTHILKYLDVFSKNVLVLGLDGTHTHTHAHTT